MRGCRRASNEGFEIDGLHDLLSAAEQDQFDLASAREQRRERQGFVSPADARAFLQMARRADAPASERNDNPIAAAYFRSIELTPPDLPDSPDGPHSDDAPADTAEATAVVMETLAEAGIVAPPRALLPGARTTTSRLARIQSFLQSAATGDELAFLANVLMAGCAVQGRPFTLAEASLTPTIPRSIPDRNTVQSLQNGKVPAGGAGDILRLARDQGAGMILVDLQPRPREHLGQHAGPARDLSRRLVDDPSGCLHACCGARD